MLPAENIRDAHLRIRHTRSILGVLRVYALVLRVLAVGEYQQPNKLLPIRENTVIMREMAPGANGFFNSSFLAFFCAPRCHLSDGCHLTHDYGIANNGIILPNYFEYRQHTWSIEPQNIFGVQAVQTYRIRSTASLLAAWAALKNGILPAVLAAWMSSIGPWNTDCQYSQCLHAVIPAENILRTVLLSAAAVMVWFTILVVRSKKKRYNLPAKV